MDSIINLNKPRDLSSQHAVSIVKRLFSAKKAGHTGTLDPIATGVLIVCLNEATKITRFLSDLDKKYIVRLKLGERTDTYDLTGRVLEKKDCSSLKEEDIRKVLGTFIGVTKQVPPMYSAVKIKGKPLYKLARKGMEIQRPERTVNIYTIGLMGFHQPNLDLKIYCSKGTYIRTLCDDIGNALGVGAHMVSLERKQVGKFTIEDSQSIEDLKWKRDVYYSIDSALSHLEEIILGEDLFQRARNGMPVITVTDNFSVNQYVRLKGPDNNLFGIGRVGLNRIKVERILN